MIALRTTLRALACCVLLGAVARADVCELKDGRTLEGSFAGGTSATIRFVVDGRLTVLHVEDVVALRFGAGLVEGAPDAPEPAAVVRPPTPLAPTSVPSPAERPPEASPAAAVPRRQHNLDFYNTNVMIPSGTRLVVRTREPLDSNLHGVGHRFTAALEGDLVVDGRTVAPRGTDVYGEVVEHRRSGRVFGRAELGVTLTALAVDGQLVSIRTGDCRTVSESTTARSAGQVLRGAAIGALVDGSDGAEGGAKWGAGVALVTRGSSIYAPAGTLIEFVTTENATR